MENMNSGRFQRRGVELLKLYSRAKRLGILEQPSMKEDHSLNQLLDEWRLEQSSSSSAVNCESKAEVQSGSQESVEEQQLERSEVLLMDDDVNSAAAVGRRPSSDSQLEEEASSDDYFDVLLKLEKERHINLQLRREKEELEKQLQSKGKRDQPLLSNRRPVYFALDKQKSSTSSVTQSGSNSKQAFVFDERVERRVFLSQSYVNLLVDENRRLKELFAGNDGLEKINQ